MGIIFYEVFTLGLTPMPMRHALLTATIGLAALLPTNLPAFGAIGHLTTGNKNTTHCAERSTLLTIRLITVETLIDAIQACTYSY